jgi:hypothetical protein
MASEPAIQMPGKSQIQIGNTQAEHRINILNAWHGVVKLGTRDLPAVLIAGIMVILSGSSY